MTSYTLTVREGDRVWPQEELDDLAIDWGGDDLIEEIERALVRRGFRIVGVGSLGFDHWARVEPRTTASNYVPVLDTLDTAPYERPDLPIAGSPVLLARVGKPGIDFDREDPTDHDSIVISRADTRDKVIVDVPLAPPAPVGWLRWTVLAERQLPTHGHEDVLVWWLDGDGVMHRSLVEIAATGFTGRVARLTDFGERGTTETERMICDEVIAELVCAAVHCERYRRGMRADDPLESAMCELDQRLAAAGGGK